VNLCQLMLTATASAAAVGVASLRAALQEIAKLHGVWGNGMHAARIADTALKG